ncbi:MAG: 1-acyl-sn-glycerol-3-phosphate acyltransferase [Actinomycetia bacterium]|nr:1-acyl-sn-glycerol-3-phosphate acyltransferase [Actinomycetes bacterium]
MLPSVEFAYATAAGVLRPLLRHGMRWTVEGAQLVPAHGPAIFASNHISYLDPFVIAKVTDLRHRRVRFLAKAELFGLPVVGPALRNAGQIPVDRNSLRSGDSTGAAGAALARGECVAVFPEGTISPDLEPMSGKSGTARIARATGAPVFPLGLWGTQRIMAKGRRPDWRWGVAQSAVVGPPLRFGPDANVRETTDEIMSAVAAAVARAREIYPQSDPGSWWDRAPETATLQSCRA